MKLQIEAQQLRVRVSESEFARLLSGQPVDAITDLPGSQWQQSLRPLADGVPALQASAGNVELSLPIPLLLDYQQRLPCRDGIEWHETLDDGSRLTVAFEVDVRDSIRTRGPQRRPRSAE